MKATNLLIAGLAFCTLAGCSTYRKVADGVSDGVSSTYQGVTGIFSSTPGASVEFVSASSASVLVDFGVKPAGEQEFADKMAAGKCAVFGKKTAELESLNPRGEDRLRGTYLCK
jgi:hypothetical protein